MERVLNLIMTIGSRRGIDRQRLFSVIPEYAEAKDAASLEKMFERDKRTLRELGIPLETVEDTWDPSIVEYRIGSGVTDGDLDVTDAEYTILLAASRAWDDAAAGGAARRVRAKLQTYPHTADEDLLRSAGRASVESLPVLSPLLEAVTHAQTVAFQYRRSDGSAAERTVEVWSVGVVDGYWYLLGFDRDRGAERVFRASRIESFPRLAGVARAPRPEHVDLSAAVALAEGPSEEAPSRLRVAPWKALGLREDLGADLQAEILDLPPRRRTAVERLVRADSRWITLEEPAAWREDLHRTFAAIEQAHLGTADLTALQSAPQRPAPRIRVSSSGGDHVARLMAIASHVQQVGEARIEDLAERFGVSEKQLRTDLEILFLCGDLGSGWEDLIEVEWEGGSVRVRNADPLRRRFHLTRTEAIALLAGIGALGRLTGEAERAAASVRAKLAAIIGPTVDTADSAAPGGLREEVLAVIRRAIAEQRPVKVLHSPPDRPGAQERLLTPALLETEHGRTYVRGTVPAAAESAERMFRIDRIVAARLAEEEDLRVVAPVARPAEVPPGIVGREEQEVWLRLEGPALWIAEAFDAVELREGDEHGTFARLARPVRSALLDAVMEAGGAAELLAPDGLREAVAVTAGAARAVHAVEHG